MFKMDDTGSHSKSYPIPSSFETIIPKPSKTNCHLVNHHFQAVCESCVYFAVQSIHVLQLGTIKHMFV